MFFKRRKDEPPGGENDCTEPVRRPYEACTDAVRNLYGTVQKLYGEDYVVQNSVRSWIESFPEIEKFDRHRPLKWVLSGGAVVAALWSIYSGRPVRSSLFLAVLAGAVLVGCDVLGLFGRILAARARTLVMISLLTWAGVVMIPARESVFIALTTTGASALLIAVCNIRWLSAQVYRRSPTVQKALAKTQSAPVEDLWSGTVQRMVRTLLWELGLSVSNPIWWDAMKGVWVIGYSMASKVTAATVQNIDALKMRVADLEDDLADRDAMIDANLDFFQEHERYVEEVAALRDALEEARSNTRRAHDEARENFNQVIRCEEYIHTLEATIEGQKNQIADLQAQTEKMIQTNGPVPVVTEEERQEQLLWAALRQGMGVARMAKYAGVTHHRAQVFAAEHREEHEAAKAKIAAKAEEEAV